MMQFGLRLHDSEKLPLEERLKKVKAQGFSTVHLALSKIGLPSGMDEKGYGVLTPGYAFYLRKIFEEAGINIAIISGENSKAIDYLKMKCPTIEAYQGIRIKIDVLKQLVEKYYLSPEEVVYIGDDVNDIMCLEAVKYKVTVPNANRQVKKIKGIQITNNYGGDGAFREVVDSIICPKF